MATFIRSTLRKFGSSDWITLGSGMLIGVGSTLAFVLSPIRHLPLLWIYDEKVKIELLNPKDIFVGESADLRFHITPLTPLGLSKGTAQVFIGEGLSTQSDRPTIQFENEDGLLVLPVEPSIKVRGEKEGLSDIKIELRTRYRPESFHENFTITVKKRDLDQVSEHDWSGIWKLSLHGTQGSLRIQDSDGKLGGVYEFEEPFMGKSNGPFSGHYDGDSVHLIFDFGATLRVVFDGEHKSDDRSMEMRGSAYRQVFKNGQWDKDVKQELKFLATAGLLP